MSQAKTFTIPRDRVAAISAINAAPENATVTIKKQGRNLSQNRKFWAMLGEVARQKEHNGRKYSPEIWRYLFLSAFGIEVQTIDGLGGEPVPVGTSSSALSKETMADLITFIHAWAAENDVRFADDIMPPEGR